MNRLRVLFVCVGNACRSQMAEAFTRHFAGEMFEVQSAGLMPLHVVPAQTRKVMAEKGIPTEGQFPKGVEIYQHQEFDLVINMSGTFLPRKLQEKALEWTVKDPYGSDDEAYRETRDELADRIADLIADVKANGGQPPPAKAKVKVKARKRGFFGWGNG